MKLPLKSFFSGIPPQGRISFYGKASKGHQPKTNNPADKRERFKYLERIKTSVSDFSQIFTNDRNLSLSAECERFRAGRVSQFYENWKTLTCDQQILQNILGTKVDCVEAPEQHNLRPTHFNHNEGMIIDAKIEKLISKGVIEPASHKEGEILSNIFIRPKADGTYRMTLNLKEFN